MSTVITTPSTALRPWLLWTASFVSFPAAGILGGLVAGPVDGPLPALLGGLVSGAVIGLGQSLLSSRRIRTLPWVLATATGTSLGLLLGGLAVGFGTTLPELVLMGAVTGVPLGLAQALALPLRQAQGAVEARSRVVWAAAMPVLWALGWLVTTVAGVEVGEQFTNFGATGAITVSALSGVLLHLLRPVGPTATDRP